MTLSHAIQNILTLSRTVWSTSNCAKNGQYGVYWCSHQSRRTYAECCSTTRGNYGIALGSLIAAADNHSKYVDDNNGVDLVKVDRAIHIRDDYVSQSTTTFTETEAFNAKLKAASSRFESHHQRSEEDFNGDREKVRKLREKILADLELLDLISSHTGPVPNNTNNEPSPADPILSHQNGLDSYEHPVRPRRKRTTKPVRKLSLEAAEASRLPSKGPRLTRNPRGGSARVTRRPKYRHKPSPPPAPSPEG
jgi:hypothetical protein